MTIHKLGKKAPRLDPRTLRLARYLKPKELPTPPAEVSWVTKVPDWKMYRNDFLGDCVPAAAAHHIDQWSYFARGSEVLFSDEQIVQAYSAIGGYVPGDPSTDNGCDMLTALNYWRTTGISGHKILAFMAVDWNNASEVQSAIQLFGSVFTGIGLPVSAQGQDAWTVADGGPNGNPNNAPWSWGGHCVATVASSPLTRTVVTWGMTLKMSHNFWLDYVDECYVALAPEWIETNGLSPSGFNLAQLTADLAQL